MHLPAKQAHSRASQLRRCIAKSIHLQHPRFRHRRTLQDAENITLKSSEVVQSSQMCFTGIKNVWNNCRRRGAPVEEEAFQISNTITTKHLLCLALWGASIIFLYAELVNQNLAMITKCGARMLAINLLDHCHRHTPRRLRACHCHTPLALE